MNHSKIPRSIPKTKTKVIFYTDKFSRSNDRILQSVSKVLTATLVMLCYRIHRLLCKRKPVHDVTLCTVQTFFYKKPSEGVSPKSFLKCCSF